MAEPDFERAQNYVRQRLVEELSPKLIYHSVVHTFSEVLPAAELLARLEGLDGSESLLLLRTAALYHDVGYVESYNQNEAISVRIAAETLPEFGYSASQIEEIGNLIMVTQMPQNPQSYLGRVLADSDLYILGQDDFLRRSLDLHQELAALGTVYSLEEWYHRQIEFLRNHRYFTNSAIDRCEVGKQRNIQILTELLAGERSHTVIMSQPRDTTNSFEAILGKVPLFQSLPLEELRHLAVTLKPIDYSPGEVLFREGEHGDHFYIVIEGQLEILKALETPDERVLNLRGPGEFIGEMSLFNPDGLRTASVRAFETTRVLEMTRDNFEDLLNRHPKLVYEIVRVLSARLNASHNRSMQDLQEKNRELTLAYEELKAAQVQLIEKERLERELQVAYEIQMSILPETLPEMGGFEFGRILVPARAVGGDFYDLIPLCEGKVGIIVGDVTDKGVPAAIFMAQTHALLRAEASHEISPGETLQAVNRQLLAMNRRQLFATVIYGILDQETHQLTYARAGHELPLLHMPDGAVVAPELLVGQPLGIFEKVRLDEQTLVIPPGSTLMLYTDGVTDELAGASRKFGLQGLIDRLQQTRGMNAQQICDYIYQSLLSYKGEQPQFDDVTMITVRSLG